MQSFNINCELIHDHPSDTLSNLSANIWDDL
uniref:Uncharacterized protein n=1 Tax=viral metagenome TaxID=1070528 RepID=A0A6C0BNF7_9ZZZZ